MPAFYDRSTGFRGDTRLHGDDFAGSPRASWTGRFIGDHVTGVIRDSGDRDVIELDLQSGINRFVLTPSLQHPRLTQANTSTLTDGLLELLRDPGTRNGDVQVVATGVRDATSGTITLSYTPTQRELQSQSESPSFIYSLRVSSNTPSANVTSQRGYLINRSPSVVDNAATLPHGRREFSGAIEERGFAFNDEYRDDLTGTLASMDLRTTSAGTEYGARPNRIFGTLSSTGREIAGYEGSEYLRGDGIIDHYYDSDVFITPRLNAGRTYVIETLSRLPSQRFRSLNRDHPGAGLTSRLPFTSDRGPNFEIYHAPRTSISNPDEQVSAVQTPMFDAWTHTDRIPRASLTSEWWRDSEYNSTTRRISGAYHNQRLIRPSRSGQYAIQVYPNSPSFASAQITPELRENLYGIGGYSVLFADVTSDPRSSTHIDQLDLYN